MAMKDWKKITGISEWFNKDKELRIWISSNKFGIEKWYFANVYSVEERDIIEQSGRYKSRSSAINWAKRYMRKH